MQRAKAPNRFQFLFQFFLSAHPLVLGAFLGLLPSLFWSLGQGVPSDSLASRVTLSLGEWLCFFAILGAGYWLGHKPTRALGVGVLAGVVISLGFAALWAFSFGAFNV